MGEASTARVTDSSFRFRSGESNDKPDNLQAKGARSRDIADTEEGEEARCGVPLRLPFPTVPDPIPDADTSA